MHRYMKHRIKLIQKRESKKQLEKSKEQEIPDFATLCTQGSLDIDSEDFAFEGIDDWVVNHK